MVERRPEAEAGWRIIDTAVARARARLGDGLLSAYAIGSLAHGGFCAAVSDVDLALLTDDRPGRDTPALISLIAADVSASGGALADRLSIFHAAWTAFRDPPPAARFPPIDRHDLVHYGVLVHGRDLRARHATAPDVAEMRAHAVEFALRRVSAARLADDLRRLVERGVTVHDATKLVLWPVRLQHVADTGLAGGNAAAAEHYLALPGARHRRLVADALAWRELPVLRDPAEASQRISREIEDLYAEVLGRLAAAPGVPHGEALARAARELTGSAAAGPSP